MMTTNKTSILFALLLMAALFAPARLYGQTLLPRPQMIEWHSGTFDTHRQLGVVCSDSRATAMAEEAGFDLSRYSSGASSGSNSPEGHFKFALMEGSGSPEAYRLSVGKDTVGIAARAVAGFRYA